jgi:taurine dioxygenase
MSSNSIVVQPIAGAIGAEISGIDLAANMGVSVVATLRQALLDHLVVFFRGQSLTPAQFLAVARRFGTPIEYPFVKGLPEYPEIIEVVKEPEERINFGGIWHSDTTYLDIPPMGSMLLAREIPTAGGDTLFANMYLAYETLSQGMRTMLEGLRAVSSSTKADVTRTREDRMRAAPSGHAERGLTAEHPVVRTHPETGRKALFVNVAHTERFSGMTVEESAPLLDFLFRHQTRPEFTCRFRWSVGALAFWDNRAAQHNPINDYHGHRRAMLRITLAGDRPR